MTNKEIANKKKEIERLILSEKNKIKAAEENKKSFELRQGFSNANKPKPVTTIKPSYKADEPNKMFQPKVEQAPKIEVAKVEKTTSDENNENQNVGKIFYIVSIAVGVLLIAAIVILMIGIISEWGFWM